MTLAKTGSRRRIVTPSVFHRLPRALLPDTAVVATDGSLVIGGCASTSWPTSSARRCSSTTRRHMRARCREAVAAFGAERVVYATKAFLCRAMARLGRRGRDCCWTSPRGGELHVALAAGVPAVDVHASRQQQERSTSCARHSRSACATSSSTASTSSTGSTSLHGDGVAPAPDVLLRITPGVHAHTHEYIATGQDDSKFGFNLANGDAAAAVERAARSHRSELVGSALPHRIQRVRRRQLRPGRRGDGRLRRAARPARARARRRARRGVRRG